MRSAGRAVHVEFRITSQQARCMKPSRILRLLACHGKPPRQLSSPCQTLQLSPCPCAARTCSSTLSPTTAGPSIRSASLKWYRATTSPADDPVDGRPSSLGPQVRSSMAKPSAGKASTPCSTCATCVSKAPNPLHCTGCCLDNGKRHCHLQTLLPPAGRQNLPSVRIQKRSAGSPSVTRSCPPVNLQDKKEGWHHAVAPLRRTCPSLSSQPHKRARTLLTQQVQCMPQGEQATRAMHRTRPKRLPAPNGPQRAGRASFWRPAGRASFHPSPAAAAPACGSRKGRWAGRRQWE